MILPTVVRWLDFVGLATLVGALAFRCLIVRPHLFSRREFNGFERAHRRVVAASIGLVALTSVADLVLRTLLMSGGNVADLGSALPVVLRQTHYGAVWIARISLLGVLAMAWLLGRQDARPVSLSSGLSLIAATLVTLTTTLSGHAADWGDFTLPVLIDWLHLLAASTWFGGLFTLGFVFHHSFSLFGGETQTAGLSSIAARFSRMAACCAAVFLPAGLYNAWLQVTSPSSLVSTAYGWTLVAKLSLVGLVLMTAGLNRYYFVPLLEFPTGTHDRLTFRAIARLAGRSPVEAKPKNDQEIRHQFFRFVRLEWIIVIAALACTALLTQLPPARHIR
ncbi:MAG: CopD family protein, partial [Candidatus Methylomirabilis oxyfera]|nr:CopD family protein [Candidatus Methylomirabilis oxyfera]